MHLANYCIALANHAGAVNVSYIVSSINQEFGLVDPPQNQALIADVTQFYNCLTTQQITSVDLGAYWKWRAMSALDAKAGLAREPRALQEAHA
jgi:hypothetical protein